MSPSSRFLGRWLLLTSISLIVYGLLLYARLFRDPSFFALDDLNRFMAGQLQLDRWLEIAGLTGSSTAMALSYVSQYLLAVLLLMGAALSYVLSLPAAGLLYVSRKPSAVTPAQPAG